MAKIFIKIWSDDHPEAYEYTEFGELEDFISKFDEFKSVLRKTPEKRSKGKPKVGVANMVAKIILTELFGTVFGYEELSKKYKELTGFELNTNSARGFIKKFREEGWVKGEDGAFYVDIEKIPSKYKGFITSEA